MLSLDGPLSLHMIFKTFFSVKSLRFHIKVLILHLSVKIKYTPVDCSAIFLTWFLNVESADDWSFFAIMSD